MGGPVSSVGASETEGCCDGDSEVDGLMDTVGLVGS